jgi:hypothetical protein
MASSGTPRHSKRNRPGVTIELAPADVMAVSDDLDIKDLEAEDIPSEPSSAPETPGADEAGREVPHQPAASAPPARGLPGIAGGFLGGALALAAGAGLQWAGILPTFGNGADIAALRQEIAALSEKTGAPAADPAVMDGLTSGQAALVKSVETLGADIDTAKEAQKSLSNEFSALKASGGAAGGDSTALTEKLAALETRLDALKGNDASAQLAAIQAQIAALKQSSGNASGASNVAQAIAAAGLKAAIDRGGSFANELETFATVAPASPELEQLKNLAASGVPSKAELSAEFGKAADAMLAAAQPADPNAGLIARLTASAKSLVRSRPVGVIEGDAPEALVARMEVAVSKGDLDAALAEAGKLPDAARAAGIDYVGRLTARRDTDALVTKALTSALSAAGAAK